MKNLEKKVRAHALKNALAHEGKARQGPVISALFNEGLKKTDIKKYGKQILEIILEVNNLSLEKQKKEFNKIKNLVSERETREGLPELPNVPKSGVVMRFGPAPSGRLHIGHARTFALSYLYFKKYGGKLYLRIEDTNPENIYKPAYKYIESELKWLFGNSFKTIIQSERMNLYYKYIEKLINKKSAYVCTCSADEFRGFVKLKKNCPCRKHNSRENLEKWKKMLLKDTKKQFKEGEAVLRFKTPKPGMAHPNPAMRDFPLARINETPHPLQGQKYRVWPLMNLAVTVDDIELKMTHIIRGKDHRDNAERQEMIFSALGLKKKTPWTGFIGRYKFKDFELSKTKILEGIKSGKYSAWDDPKLATIASLKKKYKPSTIIKFAEKTGLTEVDKIIDKKDFYEMLDNLQKEK